MIRFLKKHYIPTLLFLAAFLSKLFFINSRDICIDEPFTIFHAQESIKDILHLSAENVHPPTFMLLLHFWMELFGNSPLSVRILPLLFNALTVVYLYLAGKDNFSKQVGLFAAGLFLLSTYHFYFGLETRAYSLLSLATIASYFYYNKLMTNANLHHGLLLLLSNLALVYSNYFGWFVIFVQALSTILYFKQRKAFKAWWMVLTATCIGFIPLGIVFISHLIISTGGTWLTPPQPMDYFNMLHYFLNDMAPIFILALLIGGIMFFKGKLKLKKNKKIIILFIWWFVPYTIMFLVSWKMPMFINRYVLFNSLPFYLFISALLSFLFTNKNKWYRGISILLLLGMFIKLEINAKSFYYREVKLAVEKVKDSSDKNSIIIIHPHWAHLGFTYYYNREIFSNPYAYDSLLTKNNIYPVWNKSMAEKYIADRKPEKVVYYQDGSIFAESENIIYKQLQENHTQTDSVFFPQCFYVSTFNINPKTIKNGKN